jgi:hypothetical protein
MHLEIAHATLPELLAAQIERGGENGTVVEEVDEQPLAIAHDIGRGLRRDFVALGVEVAAMHDGLPARFARRAIKTEHELLLRLHIRRGEQHLITHDNRRAMPATAHRGLPDEVFTLAPLHRQFLSRSRMTIARGTSPCRPVSGEDGWKW